MRIPTETEANVMRALAASKDAMNGADLVASGTIGQGSVYTILGRLEVNGAIYCDRYDHEAGKPRPFYKLTKHGRQALKAVDLIVSLC